MTSMHMAVTFGIITGLQIATCVIQFVIARDIARILRRIG